MAVVSRKFDITTIEALLIKQFGPTQDGEYPRVSWQYDNEGRPMAAVVLQVTAPPSAILLDQAVQREADTST